MKRFSYRDLYSDKRISLREKIMITIERILDSLLTHFAFFLIFCFFDAVFNKGKYFKIIIKFIFHLVFKLQEHYHLF